MENTKAGDRAAGAIRHTPAANATVVLVAVSLALLLGTGCAPKQRVIWQPKPMVQWNHLTAVPVPTTREGYRIIPRMPSRGLFPASLGVTRVTITQTSDPLQPFRSELTTDPRNEFLRWNGTLDDQMAVAEVFPIVHQNLGGGEAVPEQILAAFHALDARLGLTYAVNELTETQTEMFGVLFDTSAKQPIASLHASAVSTVPPLAIAESEEPIDLWETDSRALVRAKFETLLRECIHELILRDKPAAVFAPVGWKPLAPRRPVAWPPRHTPSTP